MRLPRAWSEAKTALCCPRGDTLARGSCASLTRPARAGVELGSVADCESPSQRRAGAAERTADFYIKDTLIFLVQSCVGAAVLLVLPAPRAAPRLPRNATRLSAPPLQAGVFALHGAIRSHQDSFASAAAHARAPRHKWAGTQAVSNNVRLEAERTWLDKSRDAYVRGDAPPDETGIAVPVPPPAQPHLRGKSLMTLVSAARPPSSPPRCSPSSRVLVSLNSTESHSEAL